MGSCWLLQTHAYDLGIQAAQHCERHMPWLIETIQRADAAV